jgi:hypothetical membrane protein
MSTPLRALPFAGFAAFALSITVAGAFNPDYSHVREGISALATTDSPAAPIMIAGFLALALGTAAAGVALWVRLPVGVAGRIGAVLVVLAGLGMVVVGGPQARPSPRGSSVSSVSW